MGPGSEHAGALKACNNPGPAFNRRRNLMRGSRGLMPDLAEACACIVESLRLKRPEGAFIRCPQEQRQGAETRAKVARRLTGRCLQGRDRLDCKSSDPLPSP